MSECLSCDWTRQILCIDCYRRVDDVGLPATYAEYVYRAAGYGASPRTGAPVGLALVRFLAAACVFAALTTTKADERVRQEVAALYAKTRAINESFEQLRSSRECAEQAFRSDFRVTIERATRGDQIAVCEALARSWP
jgi:hypothetical protein